MSSEVTTTRTAAERGEQNLNADAQAQWSHEACEQSLRAVTEAAQGHEQEEYILYLVTTLKFLCQQICSTAFIHVQQAITWSGAEHRNEYTRCVEPLAAQCCAIRAQLGLVCEKLSGLFLGNDDGLFAMEHVQECTRVAEDDQRRCATAAMKNIGKVEPVVVMDPDVLRQLSREDSASPPAGDRGGGPKDEDPGNLGTEWSV